MQEDPFTHFATLLATHFITALVFDGKTRNAPGFFVGMKNLQPLLLPSFHWRLFASLPLSQCEHHARKKKSESLRAPRLLVSRDCTYGHHPGVCPPSRCGSSSPIVCSMHIRSLVISFWHVHRLIVWNVLLGVRSTKPIHLTELNRTGVDAHLQVQMRNPTHSHSSSSVRVGTLLCFALTYDQ